MRNRLFGVLAVVALALTATGSAWAAGARSFGSVDGVFGDAVRGSLTPPAQHHGETSGHLPPSNANVDLVSRLELSGVVTEEVTDVATYRDTAFVGNWGVPVCPAASGWSTSEIRTARGS